MAGGGGSSGGFESYLPIAAALAATVMTDGAASPWLVETMGSEAAAGAVMGAGAGALTGGGVAALTGQNVGQNALMGGVAGGTLGYGMAPGATVPGVSGDAGIAGLANANGATAYGAGADPISNMYGAGALSGGAGNAAATTAATGAGTGLFGTGITGTQAAVGLGGLGLVGAINQDNKRYGGTAAAATPYTGGNLAKFHYDPANYNPDVVQPPRPPYQANYAGYARPPGYAGGGLLDPNSEPVDFMGGDMYPQSQQQRSYYATPSQMPTSAQQTMASYEPQTNPLTGEPTANMRGGGTGADALKDLMGSRDAIDKYTLQYAQEGGPAALAAKAQGGDYNAMIALKKLRGTPNANYAGGGIANLGGYSDGGRMLKGPGDGMSDSIPASIQGKQPARLADNEFVVPADVVSHLGNGSSDAGAKKLYAMMNKVRQARTGKAKQAPAIKADKYMPA